ncbi:MAG: hypothetical protein JM58_01810 [Peptococcaceae bacterium BICA1-8]|nr:MAG: hypothetical protein JM58_01810 [Peptococcaceae bacterium BICA1-8]
MEKIIRWCDRITQIFGFLAGFMMLIGLSLVIMEVILRSVFNKTLYITEEYSGYLMVAITFMALAYTLKEKGHIRMTFLHGLVKGRARIVLDMYSYLIGFVFFAIITGTTYNFFWDAVVTQSRSMQISSTYLAVPQFFMPLGCFVITLQFLAEFLRSVMVLRSGAVIEQPVESNTLGR